MLVAFAMLTGARDGALSSFRLKHVDIAQGLVDPTFVKRRPSRGSTISALKNKKIALWGLFWGPFQFQKRNIAMITYG
jgi:hypothetical protein